MKSRGFDAFDSLGIQIVFGVRNLEKRKEDELRYIACLSVLYFCSTTFTLEDRSMWILDSVPTVSNAVFMMISSKRRVFVL